MFNMARATKDNRVRKAQPPPRKARRVIGKNSIRQSELDSLIERRRGETEMNADQSDLKMPPKKGQSSSKLISLVDSVNKLAITEFKDTYVPEYASRPISIPSPNASTSNGQADRENYDTYSLHICSSKSISKEDFEDCLSLIRLTSSEAYKHSSFGWSPVKKRKEMKLLDMKYILLLLDEDRADTAVPEKDDSKPRLGGFLSFMVTDEDDIEVLYCYEIHLAPELQHLGVGKQLLHLFEDIGRNVGLKKGMLTVFKANKAAIRFYEMLGYEEDEFSPKPMKLRNGNVKDFDYMIFSKDFTHSETRLNGSTANVIW